MINEKQMDLVIEEWKVFQQKTIGLREEDRRLLFNLYLKRKGNMKR